MKAENLDRKDLLGKDFILLDKNVDCKNTLMERINKFSLTMCEDCGVIFDPTEGGSQQIHFALCSKCLK